MTIKRWLLDLGNTRLKMAPLHKGARGEVTAMPHGDDDNPFDGNNGAVV